MLRCFVDHIAVTAPSLEVGAAYVREVLGVSPQEGGEHPRMGTHNLLLRLGDSSFLEVIAPNPAAPAPHRPRWFALDTLRSDSAAALRVWVVRSSDIRASVASCTEGLGEIEPMSRGALDWLITVPADGSLPLQGVAPVVIQWQAEAHPAARLHDHGLSLARLELFHPETARVERLLASLGLEHSAYVSMAPAGSAPRLVAHIDTPRGVRELEMRVGSAQLEHAKRRTVQRSLEPFFEQTGLRIDETFLGALAEHNGLRLWSVGREGWVTDSLGLLGIRH